MLDMVLVRISSIVRIWQQFLYICANPFIYAIKFDPVRRILAGLMLCETNSEAADGSIEMR